tara:strand:+ start:19 stop:831 length:813 start_codon:yes stop_codon:yes gene_type:complete
VYIDVVSMSGKITINVNSVWLLSNINDMERQIIVFIDSDYMRLITIFDNIGMSQKTWRPNAGNSNRVEGKYSWEMSNEFKHMIRVYAAVYNRMNITLDLDDDTVALDSHDVTTHGFRWKEHIEIDGDTTWELDDNTVAVEMSFDWRDLEIILKASEKLNVVQLQVGNDSNDVLWEGFDLEGVKCWAHQNQRLNWKYGEAKTRFNPSILLRILNTMEKPKTYGTNTKISILKNKILMIESKDTIAYLSPVLEETQISSGEVNDVEDAPEVN